MPEPVPVPAPGRHRRPSLSCHPIDVAHADFRHAVRGLVAVAVLALGLLALVLVAATGDAPGTVAVSATIIVVGSIIGLLVTRVARHARLLGMLARQDADLPRELLGSADAFARSTAGADGTVSELVAIAADHGCEVVLWDDPGRTLRVPAAARSHQVDPAMARRMLDLMGRRRPIRIPDISSTRVLPVELAAANGTRSLLVAPMWAAGQFLGMVVRRYPSRAELYSTNEADRVGALASIGAVALGKAQVVDRERERASDNAMLLRAVETSAQDRLPDLLDTYAVEARAVVGATAAALVRLQGRSARLIAGSGLALAIPPEAQSGELSPDMLAWLRAGAGRPRAAGRADLEPQLAGLDAIFGRAARRYVLQPVDDGRNVVAVIVLAEPARELGEREQDLLTVIARQVCMAVERNDMTRVMEQRSQRLARAPQLARRIAGQRDPRAVARLATRELAEGFGYCRVSIALVEAGDLRIVASAGALPHRPTPTGACAEPLLEVFRDGAARVMCGSGCDGGRDSNAPHGCCSQLVVPLVGGGQERLGVIAVYGRGSDALTEDDLHLLESVADHLAATLQQAGLYEELEASYFKTVEALATALEAKDAYTLDHSRSITEVAALVGSRLGMGEDELRELRLGALLHDIGKIGIPTEILNKPGPLDDEERLIMERHTVIGEQIIAPVEFLENIRPLVLHEHERWDGQGYPHGLAGHDIPLGARIIFVCDAWHAMTSNRPYRAALDPGEARKRLRSGAGSQFDPEVVTAFLELDELGVLDAASVSSVTVTTA